MKHTNLIITIIYTCSIFISSTAEHEPHPVVLDYSGKAVVRGEKYFIMSINNGSHPMVKLFNESSTLQVGLEADDRMFASGLPLVFSPFVGGEKMVKENKNLKISFPISKVGEPVVTWKVGLMDPTSKRRLVVTGDNVGYSNYFYVKKSPGHHRHVYGLGWCPNEICGNCNLICGVVGVLEEDGKRLLALDGGLLPITFVKA